ncbi:hypothetical protein CYMTET_55607 [Cymbomonas tetramitiformis]|uniref:Uncharacterized protein n=1 Tax=Cymbomonas tetramitiformis TaxID=36881 RepID=A0AAE0BCK7_9CHLO|nr:hypothetical protein CYMTET_55607 [Cymbomonas tetramitiformis]
MRRQSGGRRGTHGQHKRLGDVESNEDEIVEQGSRRRYWRAWLRRCPAARAMQLGKWLGRSPERQEANRRTRVMESLNQVEEVEWATSMGNGCRSGWQSRLKGAGEQRDSWRMAGAWGQPVGVLRRQIRVLWPADVRKGRPSMGWSMLGCLRKEGTWCDTTTEMRMEAGVDAAREPDGVELELPERMAGVFSTPRPSPGLGQRLYVGLFFEPIERGWLVGILAHVFWGAGIAWEMVADYILKEAAQLFHFLGRQKKELTGLD